MDYMPNPNDLNQSTPSIPSHSPYTIPTRDQINQMIEAEDNDLAERQINQKVRKQMLADLDDGNVTTEDMEKLKAEDTKATKDRFWNFIEKEIGSNADSDTPKKVSTVADSKPVIDTSVLAGPIPALKNFLIKSQRENDARD